MNALASIFLIMQYVWHHDAGWSSLVAREAHNLEVAGSNPAPATNSSLQRPFQLIDLFPVEKEEFPVLRNGHLAQKL